MIQPKKSLGQHFLISRNYCTRILALAEIKNTDNVLEIGPGTGALTTFLLEHANKVAVIEFDRDMVQALETRFAPEINNTPARLIIHQGNVLKTDWAGIISLREQEIITPGLIPEAAKPKIIGNLPYNIATRILDYSIQYRHLFESFTFMTQKEVSMRIQALPGSGDYGYFSLLMAFYFKRIKGFNVPPGSFSPPPKVMSHVMQLRPRFIETTAEKEFITIIKAAFSQRRKTIYNNLKSLFTDKKILSTVLEECGIAENTRPHEISLEQFLSLSEVSRPMLSSGS